MNIVLFLLLPFSFFTDGLALCALIHHFHPNLVDFKSLRAQNKTQNITIGIQAASKLGVPQLLDVEDFGLEKLSMVTYISEIYKHLDKKY